MLRKTLSVFIIATLALSLFLPFSVSQIKSLQEPTVSIINPGPDGYPAKWTAGPPRYLGTSDFIFYSNETSVNSTFFINVTIRDVANMKGWGIGVIYDNTTLSYVSAWRPTDHVFKPVENMGWTIIAPPPTIDAVNETHSIIKWGCTYIMPEGEEWTFNGTGRLCQIQFKIIKEVNETYPKATAWFAFDPDWTAVYYHPAGSEIPKMETAYFEYSMPLPVLKAEPPTYTAQRVNETFDINITINNLDAAWHLVGLQFALVYNTSILEFVRWQNTTYLEGFVNDGEMGVLYTATSDYHNIDPDLPACYNKVFVGAILLPDENATWHEPFPSGRGVIGTITFKVIAQPPVSSLLTLNETELIDKLQVRIPHEVEHCSFNFPYETRNLTITATAGGTTDPPPGTYPYEIGTSATVTAIPSTGYSFSHWELNGTNIGSANPITITMDASYALHAVFADNIPPDIGTPIQNPPADNVLPDQQVNVRVNVTDYGTGVKNVTLRYRNDTTWFSIPMTLNETSGLWEATIPGHALDITIKYQIEAYDEAGNYAVNDNAGEYFVYTVIPEFPLHTILITFTLVTTIIALIASIKPKKAKKPT